MVSMTVMEVVLSETIGWFLLSLCQSLSQLLSSLFPIVLLFFSFFSFSTASGAYHVTMETRANESSDVGGGYSHVCVCVCMHVWLLVQQAFKLCALCGEIEANKM